MCQGSREEVWRKGGRKSGEREGRRESGRRAGGRDQGRTGPVAPDLRTAPSLLWQHFGRDDASTKPPCRLPAASVGAGGWGREHGG